MYNLYRQIFIVSLCLPILFMYSAGGTYLYLYYVLGAGIIMASIWYRAKWPTLLVATALIMLLVSLFNIASTRLSVLVFQLFFIVLLAVHSRLPFERINFKAIITYIYYAYCFVLILSGVIDLIGLAQFLPDMFYIIERDNGGFRFNAFATESSYAALLLLIFYRYLYRESEGKLNVGFLMITLLSIYFTKSVYGVISILLILSMQVLSVRASMKIPLLVIGGGIILFLLFSSEYFFGRLSGLAESQSVEGMGTAGIRLLPIVFFIEKLQNHVPYWLITGNGAGSMSIEFYESVGRFYTEEGRFSTHMIGFIHDYGMLPIILLAKYALPKDTMQQIFYMTMFILISTNAGFATYLFFIFILIERASKNVETLKKEVGYI